MYVYPTDFETLWKLHAKGGKRAAYKSWVREIKAGVSAEFLLERLTAYVRATEGAEYRYLPDLSRWINAGYYETPIESVRKQHATADPHKHANDAAEEAYRRSAAKREALRAYEEQARREQVTR